MGLGSLAEGQHSLPHPRRFSEDGRSTASLPRLKIQNAGRHAITKRPFGRIPHPFRPSCCAKDTSKAVEGPSCLPSVKKILLFTVLTYGSGPFWAAIGGHPAWRFLVESGAEPPGSKGARGWRRAPPRSPGGRFEAPPCTPRRRFALTRPPTRPLRRCDSLCRFGTERNQSGGVWKVVAESEPVDGLLYKGEMTGAGRA